MSNQKIRYSYTDTAHLNLLISILNAPARYAQTRRRFADVSINKFYGASYMVFISDFLFTIIMDNNVQDGVLRNKPCCMKNKK